MKKIWTFLWQREVPQMMVGSFLFMALATIVILLDPFQVSRVSGIALVAQHSPWSWLFIMTPSLAVSIFAGVTMLLTPNEIRWI